jgi:hypothetical protein
VFSSDVTKLKFDVGTGTHYPMTMREYIDHSFKHLLRVSPNKFIPVTKNDFIKDYAKGPNKSVFMNRLGWDYPNAIKLVQERGNILMYTCNLNHAWRFVAMDDFIHNDEIALKVLTELSNSVGLEIIFNEDAPHI